MDRDQKKTSSPLEVRCPCCSTNLIIERVSGEILHQQRPKKAGPSWDEALAAGEQKRAEAEALFERGMDRERNADTILEQKFREALERADDSETPPPRIFDLD